MLDQRRRFLSQAVPSRCRRREDRYQIDLTEARFSAVNTVSDLERLLKGDPPERAVYHYPDWVQRWPVTWVRFLVHYLLLRPAVFVLGWPKIYGRENLLGVKGPVLVICNHIGDVDVGFILTALPARIRHKLATAAGGEALEALRTPPLSRGLFHRMFDRLEWFLGVSLLNLFPLPRDAGFRESFAYAGESVDRGYNVLVFPEGRHTLSQRYWAVGKEPWDPRGAHADRWIIRTETSWQEDGPAATD